MDPDPPDPYEIGRLSCVPQDFTLYRKIACQQAARCSKQGFFVQALLIKIQEDK
ncbi:hypothetical protein [Desulfatirhabdium butyrativorans]|uniref:hypothetical protein n=1 Tax=Desulfatirhabdium butyrativorans TaxID=340467 RepID=UPI00040D5283|nr:hypothetical protein [Desulfatirhabdium butyrativorans]